MRYFLFYLKINNLNAIEFKKIETYSGRIFTAAVTEEFLGVSLTGVLRSFMKNIKQALKRIMIFH